MDIKTSIKKNRIYQKTRKSIGRWQDSLRHLMFKRVISLFPSHRIRLIMWRWAGAKIDNPAAIHSGTEIWNPSGLTVKSGSVVGYDCSLDARMGLILHENVCIASQVMIWTLHHDYNSPSFATTGGTVEIGKYAWLCSRCCILPGVKIAEGTVVASYAVVTKDTEAYSVYGGVPAKKIGSRNRCLNYVPANHKLHIM